MSKFQIQYSPGATPLNPDELAGLIPNYITTQGELNELERENILEATEWALGKTSHDCMNMTFCFDLHKRMFSKVWKWAGTTRQSDKTIGVHWPQINTKLKVLFDDTNFWISDQTYGFDELAARFHHRLVAIHAFSNGNGRHARLMTEVIQIVNDKILFTWGRTDLSSSNSTVRQEYLDSLKAADMGSYESLIKFVRK